MTVGLRNGLLAGALLGAFAATANAADTPTYILNGYTFPGLSGINTDELEAKLKDKPGARITRADIAADQAILTKELEARHITGQLLVGMAEKNGHVWVIFQVQHPGLVEQKSDTMSRRFETQFFEGASRIPPTKLAAATGLRRGEPLSLERLRMARRAILAEYEKVMPGKPVILKAKMRTRPDGSVTMTWIVDEPK